MCVLWVYGLLGRRQRIAVAGMLAMAVGGLVWPRVTDTCSASGYQSTCSIFFSLLVTYMTLGYYLFRANLRQASSVCCH